MGRATPVTGSPAPAGPWRRTPARESEVRCGAGTRPADGAHVSATWTLPRAHLTLTALLPAVPLALGLGALPAHAAPTGAPRACSTAAGPYQREVEELMGLEADGS